MQENNALEAAAEPVVQENSEPTTESKENVEQGQEAAPEKKPEETPELNAKEWQERYENTQKAFEKRLSRQTASNKALEETLTQYKQKLEQLESAAPKEETKVFSELPKVMDFDSVEEYEAAAEQYTNQRIEKAIQEQNQKQQTEAQNRKMQERAQAFSVKENVMRESFPDYDAVTDELSEDLKHLQMQGIETNTFGNMVLNFENSAQLAYEVGKNNLAESLVKLDQIDMMRELVKLDASLKPAQKADKKAPKPIKPINEKGKVSKGMDKMSGKELTDYFANLTK